MGLAFSQIQRTWGFPPKNAIVGELYLLIKEYT
jgi:hypothetical protein